MQYFNAACIYWCWCVCWSVFSGLQWGDCRVLKLHCDSSRAYRMGENWQPLKRYYMCSRSLSLCLTGALGMKGKSSGKRDIGSRHGEVFVSILSIPSLSRNPNFHHSPTYRQIKAGWRGGFPQLRQLVTSLHKGELHKALEWEEVGAQISNCFEFAHIGERVVLKGHFKQSLIWNLAGNLWAESLDKNSDRRHKNLCKSSVFSWNESEDVDTACEKPSEP